MDNTKSNTETILVRRKKWKIVVAIIAFIFSVLSIFGAISFQFTYTTITNKNTTEYTGTIRQISPIGSFTIHTHEQNFPLYIVVPDFIVDEVALQELKIDDIITFRIKDLGENNTMNGISVHVVALTANGKEIITFQSVNKHFEEVRRSAGIGFGVMGGFLVLIAISLTIWYMKGKKVHMDDTPVTAQTA